MRVGLQGWKAWRLPVRLLLMLTVGCLHAGFASGQGLSDPTVALARQADFIGFVEGRVWGVNPGGEWTQGLMAYTVTPLKGKMESSPGKMTGLPGNVLSVLTVWGGHVLPAGRAAAKEAETKAHWSTWFGETGVYLVFLHRSGKGDHEFWSSLAVFPVDYHPDATGKIVSTIGKGNSKDSKHSVLSAEEVQVQLKRLLANGADASVAGKKLTAVLQPMMIRTNTPPAPVSFERRFHEVQKLVASFRIGTSKKEVEQVFREQDGGIFSPTQVRYYLGSEVMVGVSYDEAGRLNAPIQIARSSMHGD